MPEINILYMLGLILTFGIIHMFLHKKRHYQLDIAHAMLKRAKLETQEIAQLPLNNPHPQIQISEDGQILFANPATLKIFPGIDQQGFSHPILDHVDEHQSREVEFENKIYHQTISQTSVNGKTAYVIYCYDITQRNAYEAELQSAHKRAERMRQEAENAKEARGEFLANMSHELRTPMNGIIGLSDILVEQNLGGERQGLIEAVNSSAKNLLILLNDILDFSKIEAGELKIENIPFNSRMAIAQIQSLQDPVASQKGIVLKSVVDDNVPGFLIGDPSRLQQILNNLVSNALKFTEDGSVTLNVSGTAQDNQKFEVCFSVKDTGIGIPKEKQARIFEKFQQADTSTTRKYGGTGLGLAITKDLTKLMGGVMGLTSEEGVGTTFTVTLTMDIAEEQTCKEDQDTFGSRIGLNTQARIMIVDDHPINLLFMRKTFKKMGFQNCDEAVSGKQALNLFEQKSYDLIIMDCQMPDMDGFETTKIIREREDADTAPIIIAATANAMKGAEETCLAAGMDDYLSKPIDKHKLRNLLQSWIPADEAEIEHRIQAEQHQGVETHISNTHHILDVARLDDFTDGDPEAEKELMALFVQNLKDDMSALQKSFDDRDYKEWDSWAHKIYGACSHIGAPALAFVCDRGQSLDRGDQNQIEHTHGLIMQEYARLEKALIDRQKAS